MCTEDKTIAKICFADYAKKVTYNDRYSPVIYGYNAQGVLINTDVKGITLFCGAELGKVQEDGTTVLCNGSGTHTLTASLNGLTSTVPVTITGSPGLGISSAIKNSSINVYPNPIRVGERAYINSNGSAEINIYTATGQLISNFRYENNEENPIALPTEALKSGFYIVSISNKTSNKTGKLMIQ